MIYLYDREETNFTKNGYVLSDVRNDVVTWKLNSQFSLTFSYPLFARNGDKIKNEWIVKVPVPNGEEAFRIASVTTSMGIITVTAYQLFWDLAQNFIADTNIVDKSGSGALDQVLNNTQFKTIFTGSSSLVNKANARIVRMSVVNALIGGDDNSLLNRWGGEFDWHYWNIRWQGKLGEDRGVVFRNKKNLTGYSAELNMTNVITRIMPEGYNGLLLPELYVDSENIKKYVTPRIAKISYTDVKAIDPNTASNQDDAIPMDEALELLRKRAKQDFEDNNLDLPTMNYKLNVVMLENSEEYKNKAVFSRLYPGDTATFIHDEDGINVKARMTDYTWSPSQKEYLTVEFNSVAKPGTDIRDKMDSIKDHVESIDNNALEKAKENATDLINSGFGGHVRIYPDRVLIMDTNNEKTAKKVWQWNLNGFGYSKTGINGPYGLAMTMDGSIVADFITTGILNADLIKAGTIRAIDIVGSNITGSNITSQNTSNAAAVNLSNGTINFKNRNGDDVGMIFPSNEGSTGKANGLAIEQIPGYIFSINSRNADNDLVSRAVLKVPADSSGSNPILEIPGYIRGGLKSKDNVLWITAPSQVVLSGNDGAGNQFNVYGDHVDVLGNFTVYNGSKNAAHVTRDGLRATPAYETAESYLGDIGESNTGEQSSITIQIDELFGDTINTDYDYQVFITPYSNATIWVEKRNSDSFVVRSNKPNAQFGWELKAKRRGYENERLIKMDMTYSELKEMIESEGK